MICTYLCRDFSHERASPFLGACYQEQISGFFMALSRTGNAESLSRLLRVLLCSAGVSEHNSISTCVFCRGAHNREIYREDHNHLRLPYNNHRQIKAHLETLESLVYDNILDFCRWDEPCRSLG